jgi:hypothetical protein
MSDKKQLPRAGFQLRKKPQQQDDTLIKLYEESELAKSGKTTSAKQTPETKENPKSKDDLSRNDRDVVERASRKDSKLLAKEKEKNAKKLAKLEAKNAKKASRSHKKAKNLEIKPKEKKSKKGLVVFLVFLIILIGVAVATFFIFKPSINEQGSKDTQVKTTADEIYYSKLTGREVSADKVGIAATCIMIENSPEARPQSGLDQAGVVYEAIAEGGITRFMAIFQESKPQYIGPVRSLRMTYAEFAKPYHCSIAHVGGADNALNLVRNNPEYRDIDQFFNDDSYWRISSRWAPHNVYTSFEALDQLNANRGYTSSEFNGFSRIKPDTNTANAEITARNIHIEMSGDLFNIVYNYDEAANNYKRSFATGEAHEVTNEKGESSQLAPDVVIALETDAVARPGSPYSDYRTVGSGNAYIFQNGTVTTAKWQRDSVDSELRFLDENNEEIKLNRGQVWISIYPSNNSISWD